MFGIIFVTSDMHISVLTKGMFTSHKQLTIPLQMAFQIPRIVSLNVNVHYVPYYSRYPALKFPKN